MRGREVRIRQKRRHSCKQNDSGHSFMCAGRREPGGPAGATWPDYRTVLPRPGRAMGPGGAGVKFQPGSDHRVHLLKVPFNGSPRRSG